MNNHNINYHLPADDTQVYISLSPTHILTWMESSKSKRNVDKTDLIIIGTKQQRIKIVDYFSFTNL